MRRNTSRYLPCLAVVAAGLGVTGGARAGVDFGLDASSEGTVDGSSEGTVDGSGDASFGESGSSSGGAADSGLLLSFGASFTTGIIVIVVVLVKADEAGESGGEDAGGSDPVPPEDAWSRARLRASGAARTLVTAALLAEQRAMPAMLQQLANSPSAWDVLEVEAEAGRGPTLAAVSESLQCSPARLALAVRSAARRPAGADALTGERRVFSLLDAADVRLRLDPAAATAQLERLEAEVAHRGDPGRTPLHTRLTRVLDVPPAAVARAVDAELAATPRPRRLAHPLAAWDRIADGAEAAAPDPILARYAEVLALAEAWSPRLGAVELVPL